MALTLLENAARQLRSTDGIPALHEPLDDLVRAGKIRYIGCSAFAAWQVVEAQWTAAHHQLNHFVTCQDEYNLLKRGFENSLQPAMQSYGLGLIPHTPLAAGLLSGKYQRNAPMPTGARMTREKNQADRWINNANWELVDRLARGVATVASVIDPALVIIGGGLSRAGPPLLDRLDRGVTHYLPRPPRLVLSELGEEAVALGAVRAAITDWENRAYAGAIRMR